MRILPVLALALLLWPAAAARADDDYGKNLCTKHISSAPVDCGCAGDLIEDEFEEDEAEVVFGILGIMASIQPNEDMVAIERKFKPYEDKHGKAKLDDLGKRYEKLGLERKCPKK